MLQFASSLCRGFAGTPPKHLLTPGLALLAAVDIGIWSYVAHAVSPRPVVVAKASLQVMESGQP